MHEANLIVEFIANILTIAISLLALYAAIFKREKISSIFNAILNYSTQLTLNDLKYKIERLNDYNASDTGHKKQVENILHEIEGQLNGNKFLRDALCDQHKKISSYTTNIKSLSEPLKRSLVSELRESIRTLDVENYSKKN